MPEARRTTKISITIDQQVLARAKQLLRDDRSLSTFVSDAVAEAVRRAAWADFVTEYERRHGPFTEREREEARAKIGRALAGHEKRRRRAPKDPA